MSTLKRKKPATTAFSVNITDPDDAVGGVDSLAIKADSTIIDQTTTSTTEK